MSLKGFLRDIRRERNGGRHARYSDPGKGIEYNKIHGTYRVSRKLFNIDIARTPQVIKEIGEYVNVQGSSWYANPMNPMVNFKSAKVYGKGR